MDNQTIPDATRISALASIYKPVASADAGVSLTEVRDLTLWQLALWPDSLQRAGAMVAGQLAMQEMPGFGSVVSNGAVSMLRIEPLKFWVVGQALSEIEANDGAVIDLSHSRTNLRVTGAKAATVLNSFLPLDLREQSFPVGSVASTAFHHVGVTLWRSAHGYELFLPRGFALSLFELLVETSEQYDLEII